MGSIEPNATVLRIQPEEGVEVTFGAKVPGSPFRVRTVNLDFSYLDSFAEPSPEPYERVLLDALLGDSTLFIRSDEVEHSWRIVTPLLEAFAGDPLPLFTYPSGSWGPAEADALMHGEHRWRAP